MSDPTEQPLDSRQVDPRATRYHRPGDTDPPPLDVAVEDVRATRVVSKSQLDAVIDAVPANPSQAQTAHKTTTFAPGDKILRQQYELIEPLRGGRQAHAFRARRIVDDLPVFVKIQYRNTRREDEFAKQLELRETLLRIEHPNLMRCYDVGLERGALCEVFEFVDGERLSDWMSRHPELDESDVRLLIRQLAAGVQALHDATGLMHRDLKPDNIHVLEDGHVLAEGDQRRFRIVDYGTASRLDSGAFTQMAGSRLYSPPEQYDPYTENSQVSRSWDWWSVGRIVQEAIDGKHVFDQLSGRFAAQLPAGKLKPDAIEAMFHRIMREDDFKVFRVHSGMVELTEANPRATPFLPLLRGLLTYNRYTRWGYEEVQAFLRGEKVANHYDAPREAGEIKYQDKYWTLPSLAMHLSAVSAATTQEATQEWLAAKEFLYRGQIKRHIANVLHDLELEERLKRCTIIGEGGEYQELRDRDLGTALALFMVAEGGIELPNVRGCALDRHYAVRLSIEVLRTREEATAACLRQLLSADLQHAMEEIAPDNRRAQVRACVQSLRDLGQEIDQLRQALRQHQVDYPERQLQSNPAELICIWADTLEEDLRVIAEYRRKLFRSTHRQLTDLFGAKDPKQLSQLSRKVLRVALAYFKHNGFETYEVEAERQGIAAGRWRRAAAVRRASWLALRPNLGVTFVVVAVLSWLAYATGAGLSDPFKTPIPMLVAMGVVTALVTLGFALLPRVLQRDLRSLFDLPVHEAQITRSALRVLAAQSAGEGKPPIFATYRFKVSKANRSIAALPGIDVAKYSVQPVRLMRTRVLLLSIVGVLLLGLGIPHVVGRMQRDGAAQQLSAEPVMFDRGEPAPALTPRPKREQPKTTAKPAAAAPKETPTAVQPASDAVAASEVPVATDPVESPDVEAPTHETTADAAGETSSTTPVVDELPATNDAALALVGEWQGQYQCERRRALILQLASVSVSDGVALMQVEAVFHFQVAEQSGQSGAYHMSGTYDPVSRALQLSPTEWIRQPPGFYPVGLAGEIDQRGRRLTGKITHPNCGAFQVRRKS